VNGIKSFVDQLIRRLAKRKQRAPRGFNRDKVMRDAGLSAAAGLLLAILGAAGTDAIGFPARVLYWVPLMMALTGVGWTIAVLFARLAPLRTAPVAFAVVTMTTGIIAAIIVVVWSAPFLAGTAQGAPPLQEVLAPALAIAAAMTALVMLLERPGPQTRAPAYGAVRCRFLVRLSPPHSASQLIAVRSEDHYVRAYTGAGEVMLLMRLQDAVAELDGIEGAQVHRSWWVARDAVEGWRRDGGQRMLVLKGGIMAPVSRPNVRPLEAAGWFDASPLP
jgi:DNA-binding LytR/AlgR family response regulator